MSVKQVRHGIRMWLKELMISPQDVWFKRLIPPNIRHIISKPLEKHVVRKTKIPKPYEPGRYPAGINLFGLLKSEIGLAQGAKLYARALEAGNIPHTLLNLDFIPDLPQEDTTFDDRLTADNKYAINLTHINPPQWQDALGTFPQDYFDRHYNIGIFQWELETIPDDWKPMFDYVDEVWTPSEFTARTMRKETDKPVIPILYCIETPCDETLTRADFGLKDRDFLVLMMYDSNSYASRKNPGAAIDAFREAFGENPQDAKLVIKISNPRPEDIAFVEERLKPGSYFLMTERLERRKMNSLIRLCDVFLSLHRSEGFGLVLAEAMNLGTATVATNWSANTEFMPEGTACLVDWKPVPVGSAYQYEQEGLTWADADVHEAAGYLRRLTDKTQFILITHRRGTMEEADVLYGVTMQDEGISKLLELRSTEVAEKLGIKSN